MFDLEHAGINLRKAAYLEGIRQDRKNAYFTPVTGSEVRAIVGDNDKRIEITIFDMEYAAQFTWRELKEGPAPEPPSDNPARPTLP